MLLACNLLFVFIHQLYPFRIVCFQGRDVTVPSKTVNYTTFCSIAQLFTLKPAYERFTIKCLVSMNWSLILSYKDGECVRHALSPTFRYLHIPHSEGSKKLIDRDWNLANIVVFMCNVFRIALEATGCHIFQWSPGGIKTWTKLQGRFSFTRKKNAFYPSFLVSTETLSDQRVAPKQEWRGV